MLPTDTDLPTVDSGRTALFPTGVSGVSGYLIVGNAGAGTIIMSGGSFSTGETQIGAGAPGTVDIESGTWTTTDVFTVGEDGVGTLTLSGGTINAQHGVIDNESTATISGGSWNNSEHFFIGLNNTGNGVGTLVMTGGSLTSDGSHIGYAATTHGVATISGGQWTAGYMDIAEKGTGTLNVSDTGVVDVDDGAGIVTLGRDDQGVGTLNIGMGGIAGKLLAAQVTSGDGVGTVVFNHSDFMFFNPTISGTLSVETSGSGVSVLSHANTYSGGTTVGGGTLILSNSNASATGSGPIVIDAGASLAGSGAAIGDVTLNDQGRIVVASGPLRLGSLRWEGGGAGFFSGWERAGGRSI